MRPPKAAPKPRRKKAAAAGEGDAVMIKPIATRKSGKPIYNVAAYVAAGINPKITAPNDGGGGCCGENANDADVFASEQSYDADEAILLRLNATPESLMMNNAASAESSTAAESSSLAAYNASGVSSSLAPFEPMMMLLDPSPSMPMAAAGTDPTLAAVAHLNLQQLPQQQHQLHMSKHGGGGSCSSHLNSKKVVNLLKEFEEKNKLNEWPSSTNLSCYWCCHKFEGSPVGLPIKYFKGKFHVFGCFCSLECAASYNFASHESMDEIWQRYSLLNLLQHMLNHSNAAVEQDDDEAEEQQHPPPPAAAAAAAETAAPVRVRAAPPRLCLKMFGGHMTIDEFRAYSQKGSSDDDATPPRFININFPPMMTVTTQIEEINDSDVHIEKKFVPIDMDRVNKFKERVMLRRTKPLLSGQKNTLDCTMNIRCEKIIG